MQVRERFNCMKHGLEKILLTAALAVGLTGCNDKTLQAPLADGTPVSVHLALQAAPMGDMLLTRSAFVDEATQEDATIHDLWVLQFAGTEGSALLREARYYDSYDPDQMFKLIASSVPNRVVLVANTFDDEIAFSHCADLDEFMESYRAVTRESDLTTAVAGRQTSLMSGYRDLTLNEAGVTFNIDLLRTICKVNVRITNNTKMPGATEIEMKSVTVRSVASKSFFFNSYTLPDKFPAKYDGDRIDYPAMNWNDGTPMGSGDDDIRSFTFYLPVNKSGTAAVPHNPYLRSAYAPDGATYVSITGTYQDPEDPSLDRPVEYRIMLGASETDYNLLPNCKYDVDVTINDVADALTDSRETEQAVVDFCSWEHANTYIINPTTVTGAWKSYRIPVAKCYDFWNPVDGYYKDERNALIPRQADWKVEVIWSEMPIDYDVNFKWIKDDGNGYRDWFEFALPCGFEHGNMVIGLRRYLDSDHSMLSDFIWSWQMWVTDYDPYPALNYTPQVDSEGNELRFAYSVPGGDVHRYPVASWNQGGKYEGCFIMDRNLGAISTAYYTNKAKGFLMYWYGRKDPNVITQTVYPGPSGLRPTNSGTRHDDDIRYGVEHPTSFVVGGEWSGEWRNNVKYQMTGQTWADPYSYNDERKSVFDPCPPGWRLPVRDAFKGLTWTKEERWGKRAMLADNVYVYAPTGTTRNNADLVYPDFVYFYCSDGASYYNGSYELPSTLIGKPVRCVLYKPFE